MQTGTHLQTLTSCTSAWLKTNEREDVLTPTREDTRKHDSAAEAMVTTAVLLFDEKYPWACSQTLRVLKAFGKPFS